MKLIQEVMRISHDFVCCVGCCWCATDSSCGYEVKIEAPIGNIIGYAKQQYVTLWYENDEYYKKYLKKNVPLSQFITIHCFNHLR